MVRVIHKSVKGRTRYKVPGLSRSEELKRFLVGRLREKKEILSVSASTLTGNMLVSYNSHWDPLRVSRYIEDSLREAQIGSKSEKAAIAPATQPVDDGVIIDGKTGMVEEPFPARVQPVSTWHLKSRDTVLEMMVSDAKTGLAGEAVLDRYREYGANLLPEPEARSGWEIFMDQFNSLPTYLLGTAACVSALTGGVLEAVVITGVVVANAAIGYFTENEAEKTIHSLKELVRPEAEVVRDGRTATIPAENVVPGDILVLKPGAYVAADCRIIHSSHLSIDESMLTGESLPAMKTARSLRRKNLPVADQANMAFMGTLVTGGQGVAVAVATGRRTELGQLQILLQETVVPQTPIEQQLTRMGDQLVMLCGGICGVVFLLGLWRGYGMLRMLNTAISLAAAAVPEGLPAAATINFALGINNMRKHRVLVRHLQAIETLGAVQTLCLDKTGTITENRMQVCRIYCGDKGIHVDGDRFSWEEDPIVPLEMDDVSCLLRVGLLCNETKINGIGKGDDYELAGSSTEEALVRLAIRAGMDPVKEHKRHRLLAVNHRSESRLFMSTLHRLSDGRRILSLKGSPPEVLGMCDRQMRGADTQPLAESDRLRIEMANERMSGDALRVLGMAYRIVDDESPGDTEDQMIWLGLVGMSDPIRAGVGDLIQLFHEAGVETVMITGDQCSTAYAVAEQIGICGDEQLEILDSSELSAVDPEALQALAKRVHVYARVSPTHKLKIVEALQTTGKTVAMTGDGINDGPALKAANIGIAMGRSGTDVARDVADVVLEEDQLEILATALRDGRAINQNIRKSLHFFLSTNISEIMLMTVAMGLGIGFPLNVMQLMWINIISDIFPGLALSMESPAPDIMERPPRDAGEPILSGRDFKRMTFESSAITGGALAAYAYGAVRYGLGIGAGTLAFHALTVGQLLHAYSCRTENRSFFNAGQTKKNPWLNWAIGGSLILQVLTAGFPPLRRLLGLAPMGLLDAAVIGGAAALPLAVNEVTKP